MKELPLAAVQWIASQFQQAFSTLFGFIFVGGMLFLIYRTWHKSEEPDPDGRITGFDLKGSPVFQNRSTTQRIIITLVTAVFGVIYLFALNRCIGLS